MARGRQGAPARAEKEVTGSVTDAAGCAGFLGRVALASKSFVALTMSFRSEWNDGPPGDDYDDWKNPLVAMITMKI
jgi:hypothetical protein